MAQLQKADSPIFANCDNSPNRRTVSRRQFAHASDSIDVTVSGITNSLIEVDWNIPIGILENNTEDGNVTTDKCMQPCARLSPECRRDFGNAKASMEVHRKHDLPMNTNFESMSIRTERSRKQKAKARDSIMVTEFGRIMDSIAVMLNAYC
jgi:hypothetical protein